MNLRLFAVAAALLGTSLVGPVARAQNEIFLCVDDEGRKTFTNTGNTKGCKRQDVGPVMTVPAPRVPARSVASNNLEQHATPANYPRVEADTQRSRDGERRRILEDELRAEEERVGRLREEFNNGEPERQGSERNYQRYADRVAEMKSAIARKEEDIAAIKRELAKLQ